jgi:hypothetical protein
VLPLLLKLTLAPALVATATFVARRVGHSAAGMVSGLPVVAAPIVLVFSVEDGNRFAQTASASAVLGISSLVAFCVVYALTARRRGTAIALIAGWSAFAIGTAVLSLVYVPLGAGVLITLAAISIGIVVLKGQAPSFAARARSDDLLVWRLLVTAAMVLALTAAAQGLSAHLAGLLTPFPIITAVMAAFTQSRSGAPAASAMLSGLTQALISFLMFFAVLSALLGRTGPAIAYTCAVAATLATWSLLAWRASAVRPTVINVNAGTADV